MPQENKIVIFFKELSLRSYFLLLLLGAFFLPWISYGFISQSGFDIPRYAEELLCTVRLFVRDFTLPFEPRLLYLIYLYPLLLLANLFVRSRILHIVVCILPLGVLGLGLLLEKIPFFHFLGFGAYITLTLCTLLLIYLFLPKRFYWESARRKLPAK